MTSTPDNEIDPRDNADENASQEDQSSYVARAVGDSGPPPVEPGEPEGDTGTSAGDPTAGVRIAEQDAEEAVPADDGPEHPGVRRQT